MNRATKVGIASAIVGIASLVMTLWTSIEESKVQEEMIDEAVDRKITELLTASSDDVETVTF